MLAGASVIFWVAGASIEEWLGLPTTILSNAVVAIGAVAVLSIEEIVDWNDLKGVNWGVFFVIGAGLTLGHALEKTGATAWFAALLGPILQPLPYVVILAALVVLAFTLTQFMNNVTLGAILTPVLVTLGEAMSSDVIVHFMDLGMPGMNTRAVQIVMELWSSVIEVRGRE